MIATARNIHQVRSSIGTISGDSYPWYSMESSATSSSSGREQASGKTRAVHAAVLRERSHVVFDVRHFRRCETGKSDVSSLFPTFLVSEHQLSFAVTAGIRRFRYQEKTWCDGSSNLDSTVSAVR